MPGALARVIAVVATWAVAATILWWGRLPGVWRRTLALLASAAGLAFLIVAINTEGVRESPTFAVFLLGTPYVTQQVSASASLPYYVLTGVSLLLGTAGLAVGDETARRLSRRFMVLALVLSIAVALLRFVLDKVAAPHLLSFMVGVTLLPPVVGAFFSQSLREEGKGLRALVVALLAYGFAARGFVALLYLGASTLHLGSHYDVSAVLSVESPLTHVVYRFEPGSSGPMLLIGVFPQILVWPVYTLVAGLIGAGLALLATLPSRGPHPASVRPEAEVAAAEPPA